MQSRTTYLDTPKGSFGVDEEFVSEDEAVLNDYRFAFKHKGYFIYQKGKKILHCALVSEVVA